MAHGAFYLKPIEQSTTLAAAVREAYLKGVSTHKVDDLVQAPGMRATKSGELVDDDIDDDSR